LPALDLVHDLAEVALDAGERGCGLVGRCAGRGGRQPLLGELQLDRAARRRDAPVHAR
jgi:hypothetical protein